MFDKPTAEGRLSPIALSGNGSLRSITDSLEDKRSVHKRRPSYH